MNDHQNSGKIILLNGASSSGKTTLSHLLQQNLQEPFLHFSFDHLRDSNALPMKRIKNGDFDWSMMRPSVFNGFHRCLAALAETGNNLIVDHIIENEQWLSDLVKLLSPFDVFFVGVHCPLQELERREQERGNRRIGEARMDYQTVHGFADYDFEIDSTQLSQSNVDTLIDAWKSRKHPSVFERLATRQ